MEILCFFSGVAFFNWKNGYPLILLCAASLLRPRLLWLISFSLGALFALLHAVWVSPVGMPKQPVMDHADAIGVVVSIPSITPEKTQFEFELKSLNKRPVRARILLSCFDSCPIVSAGEKWRFWVKLKKPQNLGNPGGVNRVRSLRARHIEWTGYIRRGASQYLGEVRGIKLGLIKIRSYFSSTLNQKTLRADTKGVLQALTLGLGQQMSPEHWALFRRTGTTHLMVISGAHIGLIAGLTYALVRLLWLRLGSVSYKIPAPRIASIVALVMAFIYSVLAGFGVPAERAFIVCFFMLFRHIGTLSFSVWQAFRYALLAVLLFEPHSALMPGFYLSFLAVGILILMNQLIIKTGVQKTLLMQLACLLGLMPLTLLLFSYGSLNGFFANLVAIPWVGFVIIPIGLLSVFLGPILSIHVLSFVLDKAVSILFVVLNWVDRFAYFNLDYSVNQLGSVILFMLAFAVALILPFKRFLPVILVFMGCGLFPKLEKIHWGEAHIDVLDVAQGLSVVIQTAHHTLVYDTGVQFYHGGDMGQLALVPYLKTLKVKDLDMVMISHPDLDHRGGLKSLEKSYVIRELVVDDPIFYHRGESCHQYPTWQWDGVAFEFLPMPLTSRKKNNHSCVLKVTTDFGSILLPGDIENSGEHYLVQQYADVLSSSFLLVPHHESNSSSSTTFLRCVSPKAAIASYGFDNRYHFPHPKAEARYKAENIPVYSTDHCGLIRVFFTRNHQKKPLNCSKYNKD